ncbi:MAG: hypothetical protein P8174_06025 [Gemmatimonadota bacterium]
MSRGSRRRLRALLVVVGLLLAALFFPPCASPAHAQFPIFQHGSTTLELGGYVRSLTGIQDLGYTPPVGERRSGFNGEVVRLEWRLTMGKHVVFNVHNRVQAQVMSGDAPVGEAAGIGVSVVPGRAFDLSTNQLTANRLRVWHDLDRLAVTVYTGAADVTVGRQAVTWGISSLFPVADLWTQFSPFELDTEEKPGMDGVRVLMYPASGVELDGVVADRGNARDLSAGMRATVGLSSADVYAGFGKFWNELIGLGGVSLLFDQAKLRFEGAFPYDMDAHGMELPRVTLGLDWLSSKWQLTGELHYNGAGARNSAGYVAQLQDPRFARGESYFLDRYYAGGVAAWQPDADGRMNIVLSALANLSDPSLALTPLLTYDFGQTTSVSVGALQTFGRRPLFPAFGLPVLRSEYGTYGNLWFTRISVFF